MNSIFLEEYHTTSRTSQRLEEVISVVSIRRKIFTSQVNIIGFKQKQKSKLFLYSVLSGKIQHKHKYLKANLVGCGGHNINELKGISKNRCSNKPTYVSHIHHKESTN
jgi:hypothetical protein